MTYSESQLQFEFDDQHWEALLKFDKSRDFINAQEALPGAKGVDITGIKEKMRWYFLK